MSDLGRVNLYIPLGHWSEARRCGKMQQTPGYAVFLKWLVPENYGFEFWMIWGYANLGKPADVA